MCEQCGCGQENQFPNAEAIDLESMVEYAEGSVVSRTLLDAGSGTLTLFAFDEGESLSEHTTPYDAYVQVLDGEVILTIGDQKLCAGKGQMVKMPADVPHSVRAPQKFKMLLTMIKGEGDGKG
ncbi:MAG: cupin domain-containing protein [Candidatus Brocadiia bacterium]